MSDGQGRVVAGIVDEAPQFVDVGQTPVARDRVVREVAFAARKIIAPCQRGGPIEQSARSCNAVDSVCAVGIFQPYQTCQVVDDCSVFIIGEPWRRQCCPSLLFGILPGPRACDDNSGSVVANTLPCLWKLNRVSVGNKGPCKQHA